MSQQGITSSASSSPAPSFPITPYVVGPVGAGGYQTIQAAIDAQEAAGGGNTVYVQPGSYTEDLVITMSVIIQSIDGAAILTGQHTPPTTGTLTFEGLLLIGAPSIIFSTAAGTATFNINDGFNIVADGYVFDVANWTGEILMDNCGEGSTEDGVINNITGSSNIKLINVEVGSGSTRTMELNCNGGFLRLDTCNVNCPVNMSGNGEVIIQNSVKFANTLTINDSLEGYFVNGSILSGTSPAFVFQSSGEFSISTCSIDTSNTPAIAGTGTGTLNLGGIDFISDDNISASLTLGQCTSKSVAFETTTIATGLNITDNSIGAVGTDANIDVNINTKGTGDLLINGVPISSPANVLLRNGTTTLTADWTTDAFSIIQGTSATSTPSTPSFQASTAVPRYILDDTDSTATNKIWDIVVESGTFKLRLIDDAGTSSADGFTFTRSGQTPGIMTVSTNLTCADGSGSCEVASGFYTFNTGSSVGDVYTSGEDHSFIWEGQSGGAGSFNNGDLVLASRTTAATDVIVAKSPNHASNAGTLHTNFAQDGSILSGSSPTSSPSTAAIQYSSTLPRFILDDTDGSLNAKQWDINVSSGTLIIRALDDAGTGSTNALTLTRSGQTPQSLTFGATSTVAPSSPSIQISSNQPRLILDELDAAADEKQWDLTISGGTFTCRTLDDLGTSASTSFQIARSGNVAGRFIHYQGVQIGASPTIVPAVGELVVAGTAGGRIIIDDTDAASNEKLWDIFAQGPVLRFRSRTDADGLGTQWLGVTRSGSTVSSCDFNTDVTTSGKLGIKAGAPTYALDVAETTGNVLTVRVVNSNAINPFGMAMTFSGASPDDNTQYFQTFNDSTTLRAVLYSDGDWYNHDGIYGSISDVKLKENITDARDYTTDICCLKVRKFNMKISPHKPLLGFIAQEVEEVFPGLVTETSELGENGERVNIKKAIKSSVLVPMLVSCVQSQQKKIESLSVISSSQDVKLSLQEAKIAKLEADLMALDARLKALEPPAKA